MSSYLSLSIWLPIVAGIVVLLGARLPGSRMQQSRWLALIGAALGFLVSLPLYAQFDASSAGMQFEENWAWIPTLHINYHLGVDGIAMPLVLLNAFTTLLVVIAGWQVIQQRVAQYMAAFLIMSGLINGAFAAQDALLFYLFFEAMLIPLYLIIGIWGGPRRVYASIKLFLYTLLGSLLLLVGFIYLYFQAGNSFEIADFHRLPLTLGVQGLLLIAFFLAFAVKVPMVPVHTWLPDAHVEAPTGGSMVLAAITLKLGAYGFFRFALPIAPDAARAYGWIIVLLSLVAVVYIGFVALAQKDMKKLVAYSSIAHMGFVTLGAFLFTDQGAPTLYGLEGGLIQMVSHGFVSAAMFFCIGVMYDRVHSREIADYGGVVNTMPVFAAFFLLFAMANAGLPGTSGFVGEFSVIIGALSLQSAWGFWCAFFAATTLILGAAYTLWMYKRVVFGTVGNAHVAALKDISAREGLVLGVLAVAVLALGLYPEALSSRMHATLDELIRHIAQSKFPPHL